MERGSGIEVDQDLDFQRKDWRFERIGWGAMLLIGIAAVGGVFGHGPLSNATASADDGSLRIEYQRFERHGAASELTVFLRRGASTDSSVLLWIGDEFLRSVHLEQIVPMPERQTSLGDRTLYEVAMRSDTSRVSFHVTPQTIGARTLELGIAGRATLSRPQFVYP
jgi:hypothetical protein